MAEFLTFHWPCLATWKEGVQEDASALYQGRGVAVVADGVTRRGFAGSYPRPSPAYAEADTVASSLATNLARYGAGNMNSARMRGIFGAANDQVARLNRHLGLTDTCDWWERDLAGTVAAAVVVGNSTFWYGY